MVSSEGRSQTSIIPGHAKISKLDMVNELELC